MRPFPIGCLVLALHASTGCGTSSEADAANPPSAAPSGLPFVYTDSDYVSSETCAGCHAAFHESWSKTFHHTMTQVATPDAAAGPFDGRVRSGGRSYELRRDGDELWIAYDDPASDATDAGTAPRVDEQVLLLTGSHHEQRIWVAGDGGNALDLLPIAYQIDEGRWVDEHDLFVSTAQHEGTVREGEWNENCVLCHTTGGQPHLQRGGAQTRVAELTIACEDCHGPGREHVEAFSSAQPPAPGDDPRIVNPATLEPVRSAEICGQCHANLSRSNWTRWKREGARYRPGDELDVDRRVVSYATEATEPWQESWFSGTPTLMQTRFWSDGSILPSGREYNGLIESACFASGEMSCVSCHTGHGFDQPDKMLSAAMRTDHMCQQCHGEYTGDAQREHTHHDPESTGARCQSCHMPSTSWGMLRAAASHRIDSPTVETDRTSGRPNACNLCHVDRTLAWTASWLRDWYGIEPPPLAAEEQELSATVRALLAGNAVQRAFAAWAMGTPEARQASGEDWMAPLLAPLLADPVSAVRLVAHRSLRSLPGLDELDYRFDDAASERARSVAGVQDAWRPSVERAEGDGAVLMMAGGALDRARLEALLERRDDTPAAIGE